MKNPTRLLVATAIAVAVGAVNAQQRAPLQPLDVPSNATASGPGAITASPTQPPADEAQSGKHALPARGSGPVSRLFGNGTPMSYGQTGANGIGNTGGLTTGPRGSAGAVAGGGGVHAGTVVIPPGPANAARTDDVREHPVPADAAQTR
jgi:hypothetical protein